MSPAGRMGLWAHVLLITVLCRGAWVRLSGFVEAPKIERFCPGFVELHEGRGTRVQCITDAKLRPMPEAAVGDAFFDEEPPRRVPQGMAHATRVALGLPVNINTAEAQTFALLDGVSPRVAEAIVRHRERMGPFATLDDLMGVPGIGPKILGKHHTHLCVAPAGGFQRPVASAIARPVKREWLVDVVARLPQGSVSRAWGWLARLERPTFLVRALQKTFMSAVGITLHDAALTRLEDYPSLQALFVRRLQAGARPIDADPQAVVSPVDALCGATGTIDGGTLLQIKGRSYSLARLLGDEAEAARFEGGTYANLYLAPKDYHRIHAPVTGEVRQARLMRGALMPVFEESLNKVDELFARNERIITYLDTQNHGRVAVVLVGATLVGCIKVAFDETLVGNVKHGKSRTVTYDPPKTLHKGEDLGAFELGSTVVVLAERGQMDLSPLRFGERVFVGRRIGTLAPGATESPNSLVSEP